MAASSTGNPTRSDNAAPASLNAAQIEAVRHEGRPLIVLAGPGTGKTRVIVHRVAHIIGEPEGRGVEPERVLVMTFTVKAARELKERLAGLVGFSKAERINAHTLHGFGLRLLRRFGDTIDLPPFAGSLTGGEPIEEGEAAPRASARRCSLIDSAQAKRLLRQLIVKHDLFGPERAAGAEAIAHNALKHFEHFDNHALSPGDTSRMAKRWGEAVDRGEDLRDQPIGGDALESEAARQQRFASMAALHGVYVAERRRRGLLSFGDLLMLPIELLRTRADVASIVRGECRHVIVDEFQDVNQANIELLRLLAPPDRCAGDANPGGQELVVVGDDDQAIYGFRGADDRAFWRFNAIWTDSRRIALTENHRSRPRIIEVANSIIGRDETRFAPDKVIEFPSRKNTDPSGIVECVNLREDKVDGEVIAAMIRADVAHRAVALAQSGEVEQDGETWRRYAVIVRNGADAERVREALWLEGIPSVFDRSVNAIENDGVQAVLSWARLIARPREAWCARTLLLRPPMGLPIETISGWEQQYRAAQSRWRASDSGGLEGAHEDPGGYVAWLARREGDDAAVQRFVSLYEQFARSAATQSAAMSLHSIVRESGIIHADLPDDSARARRVAAVVALLRFAYERQGRLSAPGGLTEFLEYFDDLSEDERKLDRGEAADRIEDAGGSSSPDDDRPNAVRLITAHGAKGLEFDTVFVPRVHPQYGYGRAREPDDLDIPPQATEWVGPMLEGKDRVRAEERRVFYVACTRAESRLVLLAKRNKKPSKGGNLFEEIVLDTDLSVRGIVQERQQEDVLRTASGEFGVPLNMGVGGRELKHDERRREIIGRARTELRLAAAGALARLDAPGADRAELDRAMDEMAVIARRLAAAAAIEREVPLPPVCDPADSFTIALSAATRKPSDGEGSRSEDGAVLFGGRALAPPRAPLSLSYTSISDYERCPRCWYLKHMMKLDEGAVAPQVHGLALHRAMEKFYAAYRDAESQGMPLPTLDTLEAHARREYLAATGDARRVDTAGLDQLLHQVRTIHTRLHDPKGQVLEIEKSIRFRYARQADESVMHTFDCKIDRVDLIALPDGSTGYRIVDYKSGQAWESLVQPKADDLQLGIYALAWREHVQAEVAGFAEYWLASTGERGQLRLEDIELDGVRETIDNAIEGMLAGRFTVGTRCKGWCDILGP